MHHSMMLNFKPFLKRELLQTKHTSLGDSIQHYRENLVSWVDELASAK